MSTSTTQQGRQIHEHVVGTDICTYEVLPNGRLKCLACAHECQIGLGGTGVCGLRRNVDGVLHLTVYSHPAAANARDPVEKKPLYHVLPGARCFSIATVGCNFRCSFCQNWDMSQALRLKVTGEIEDLVAGEMQTLVPVEVARLAKQNGCSICAYTYTEPTVFLEYAEDCAIEAKKLGVRNVFKTNGYESALTVQRMAGLIDAANVDLKGSDEFYKKLVKARVGPVLSTIRNMFEAGIWVEVTTLVIPGENDSEKDLTDIAQYLASVSVDIPWHVTPFHPDFEMVDGQHRTPEATLERAYAIGKKAGLKFVYARSEEHSCTYCPGCNQVLVRRDGFASGVVKQNFDLSTGKCLKCGTLIPGIWH